MNRNLVLKKSSVAVVIKSRVLRFAVCALLSLVLILGLIPMPFGGGNSVGGALIAHAEDPIPLEHVTVGAFSLDGTVGAPLDPHYGDGSRYPMVVLTITLDEEGGYKFNDTLPDPNNWVQNRPTGITAFAEKDEDTGVFIYLAGTPTAPSTEPIEIVIPGAAIDGVSSSYDYSVATSQSVKFNIQAPEPGDTILFGTYPQTRFMVPPAGAPTSPANGESCELEGIKYEYVDSSNDDYDGWYRYDPIEWRVAFESGGKLLLIAEKVIDGKPALQTPPTVYPDTINYKVWSQSTIRSWLNGYGASANANSIDYPSGTNFITKSFTTVQAGAIAQTALSADSTNNPWWTDEDASALVDTTDKIFLLSIIEAGKPDYGFVSDASVTGPPRQAVATDYAKAVGVSVSNDVDNTASWWLRSSGGNLFYKNGANVGPDGQISDPGTPMNSKNGVRPALNLDRNDFIFTSESDGVFNAIRKGAHVVIDFEDMDGGNFVHQIIRETNHPVGILPDGITRYGNLSFKGWYTQESGGTEVTGSNQFSVNNVTLHARWQEGINTVTWNPMGGTVSPTTTQIYSGVTFGDHMVYLPTPVRPGYTFGGWYTGSYMLALYNSVMRDTTFYAYWTADLYAVTFNANGGLIGADAKLTANQKYNAKYVLPANPTRTGYTFDGWYTSASGGTQITGQTTVNITSAQQLYAHWNINSYTATFNANGGSVSPASSTVNYGSPIGTPPTPTRTGYTFDGWYTEASGGTKITDATAVTADVTYYAHWTPDGGNGYENNVKADDESIQNENGNATAIRSPLNTLYLKKGNTITPPVAFDGKAWSYGQTAKLTWTSGNPKVATVNKTTGKITAKNVGTAKITATVLNGKAKITFTVKVVKKALKLKKVAFIKPPKSLAVGKTKILKVKLTSPKATDLNITFKSSKPSVIQVDKAGKLYALKKGTAKITVKAGGKSQVITVKVK